MGPTDSPPQITPTSPRPVGDVASHLAPCDVGPSAVRYVPELQQPWREPGANVPNLTTLLQAAGQRWLLALSTSLLALVATGWLISRFVPSDYVASSYIRVRHKEDFILRRPDATVPDAAFIRNQERMVTLPHVLQRALDDEELRGLGIRRPGFDAEVWLRGILEVNFPKNTEVMEISVPHAKAEVAQALANAVTRAYLSEVRAAEQGERERRQSELTRLAEQSEDRLRDRWSDLQDFARGLGTGNTTSLSIGEQLHLQSLHDYAQRLRGLHLRKNRLENDLREARNVEEEPSPDVLPEELLDQAVAMDPEGRQHQQNIAQVEQRIADFKRRVTSGGPLLEKMERERDAAIERFNLFRSRLKVSIARDWEAANVDRTRLRAAELEAELASAESEEEFISQQLLELEDRLSQAGGDNGVKLDMLRHDISRESRVADSLWTAIETLHIEDGARPRVEIISEANLPIHRSQSKRLKAVLFGGPFSVLLVLLLIGYIEYQSPVIRDANVVRRLTGIEVVNISNATKPEAKRLPQGIKRLVAALLDNRHTMPKRLMVSSSRSGEGKEALAVLLATGFAGASKKPLLIDLDLANPSLHELLELPNSVGLLSVLEGSCHAVDAVQSTPCSNLQFIALERAVDDPYPLLSHAAMGELLDRLSQHYDVLIINAPPSSTSADTLLLGQRTDASILAAVSDHTRSDELTDAISQLHAVGNAVLAIVMGEERRHSEMRDLLASCEPATFENHPTSAPPEDVETALERELQEHRDEEQLW